MSSGVIQGGSVSRGQARAGAPDAPWGADASVWRVADRVRWWVGCGGWWSVSVAGDGVGGGPGGAGDVDGAVGDVDGPVAGVQVAVTPFAEQDEVGDLGFAAVDPRLHVVGVAVDGWGAAADAALVAGDEGFADRAGREPDGGADVEGLGVRAEHDRQDVGVAGESPDGGRGQGVAVDQVAEFVGGGGLEVVVVDGDGDVRLRAVPGSAPAVPDGCRTARVPAPARGCLALPVVAAVSVRRTGARGGGGRGGVRGGGGGGCGGGRGGGACGAWWW